MKSNILGFSIIILLVLAACNATDSRISTITSIYDKIDSTKFHEAIKNCFNKLKDTNHAYNAITLNNFDTLNNLFNDHELVMKWVDKGDDNFVANLSKWFKLLDNNGLDSQYYNAALITSLIAKIVSEPHKAKPSLDTMALHEILIADALYASVNDMRIGRVRPTYSGTPNLYKSTTAPLKFNDLLERPLAKCFASVPKFDEYKHLQGIYENAKKLSPIYYSKNYEINGVGKDSASLSEINCRLVQLGLVDFYDSLVQFPSYNNTIKELKKFNILLDSQTELWNERLKEQLNFDKKQVLRMMALNLERWRWMGDITANSRIWVNAARNELDAYRNDTLVLNMRVCTGKSRSKNYKEQWLRFVNRDSGAVKPQNHETPLMKSNISHIVVFPNWKIPQSILVNELLSKIRRNPGYIHRLGYKLKTYSGKEVNPYSVNWSKSKYPYYLEQPGGNGNALGKIIFYFENQFSVYCHDTPQKWAFGQANRHVSHGCIRLQKPFEFAEYIQSVQSENNMDYVRMAAGMDPVDTSLIRLRKEELADTLVKTKKYGKKVNKRFNLDSKLPIYIVYFTCEVKNGYLQRFADGYRRDEMLAEAMQLGADKRGIYL